MMLNRLGLGFILIAPILVGFAYMKGSDRDLFNFFLLLTISMGLVGGFSCLLHFMLPRKRLGEGAVVDDDSSTDKESPLKKHRIGCLITATGKAATDGNKSESSNNDSNNSVIIGSSNSGNHSGSSGVVEMAFGNGNSTDIDEDLHSRQLAVYGRETMRRLFASNILVSGMQGLGAEIGMKMLIN